MARQSLILLSGGLDSAVLAHHLGTRRPLRAIYVDIGYQSATPEKNSAKWISRSLDIPLEVVDFRGLFSMVSGFVPIEELGLGELDKGQPTPYPPSAKYVVGFHVMLSIASYYSALANISQFFCGIIKEQSESNKGLPVFIKDWSKLINRLNPKRPVQLSAPFSNHRKSELVRLGTRLGVDFKNTWSCHRPGPVHCGQCGGCAGRQAAFVEASIKDRTKYLE